jgi:hypothetical protein
MQLSFGPGCYLPGTPRPPARQRKRLFARAMLQCKPEFSRSAPHSVMQSRRGCSSRCSVTRRQRCANSAYIKRLDCALACDVFSRRERPRFLLLLARNPKADGSVAWLCARLSALHVAGS